MSYTYPKGRFQHDDRHVGGISSENAAEVTMVRCPSCDRIVVVPRGHFDFVHDCTIMCPFDSTQMKPIDDPATTDVPIRWNTKGDMTTGEGIQFFYYCPSRTCSYFLKQGVGYVQRRVQTEVQVGR